MIRPRGHASAAALTQGFERITGSLQSILAAQLLSDLGRPLAHRGILQQQCDLAGSQFRRITLAPYHAGHAQAAHPACIVRLIVAVGHHQHRFAGDQCLRGCAHAALVDNDRGSRKKSGVGRIVGHAYVLRSVPGNIARVASHQEHGTLADQFGSQRALPVKVAGVQNGCRAQGKDKRRRPLLQEALNRRRQITLTRVAIVKHKAGHFGGSRPVRLRLAQQGRKHG